MTNTIYTLAKTAASLIACIVLLIGCKDKGSDPAPITKDELIKKTFVLGATGYVKKDNVDVTSEFAGLTVTFSAGTYTTTNSKHLYKNSGTWVWNTQQTQITLDGDLPATIEELTATSLKMSFHLTAARAQSNGRAEALEGNYEVSLTTN